jgi:hypothetical protein
MPETSIEVGEIRQGIGMVANALGELHSRIDRLGVKLEPVLGDDCPAGGPASTSPSQETPIGKTVGALHESIVSANIRLITLEGRIKL